MKSIKKATEIKPDKYEAYYNWGTDLGKLADTKTGTEAEELYKESFEKYKKATEINPDFHEAYYNWGTALGKLADTKTGTEAEELLNQALEKCQKAVELGGNCYNLACVYALTKNKEKALFYLEESLKRQEIITDFVLGDEDWKLYLEDGDFQRIIDKYKNS